MWFLVHKIFRDKKLKKRTPTYNAVHITYYMEVDQWDNFKAWEAFDHWRWAKQRVILPPLPAQWRPFSFLLWCLHTSSPYIKVLRVPLWSGLFLPSGRWKPSSTVERISIQIQSKKTNPKHTPRNNPQHTHTHSGCSAPSGPAAAQFITRSQRAADVWRQQQVTGDGGRVGDSSSPFSVVSHSVGLGAPRPAPGASVMDGYSWDDPGWGKLI